MQDPCPVGLRGIVPSLNRPFTEDDAADIDHVRRLLDWTVEAGSAGMLILAVAGEGPGLRRIWSPNSLPPRTGRGRRAACFSPAFVAK
jgi:hypothetical protein